MCNFGNGFAKGGEGQYCSCCGHFAHPQLGVFCLECWWGQGPINAPDGDYVVLEDGRIRLHDGSILQD
jgi:hypothetical protein